MFGENNILKTIAKGGALAFSAGIFSGLVGLVTTLILTRFLGAHIFGIYALGKSIFLVSSKISLLGMNNGILRFFSVYREQKKALKGLLNSVFGTVIAATLILMIFYLFTAKIFALEVFRMPELEIVIRIFSIAIPLMACISIVAAIFQSQRKILIHVTIGDLDQKLLNIILLIMMFLLGLKLYGAVLAFLLSSITVFVLAIIYYNKHIASLVKGIAPTYHFRDLLQFSAPSFLIGFSYLLLTQTDRIMIGMFLESSAVGIYAVSAKMAVLMNIILASFNTIFVPYISDLYFKNRRDELAEVYKVVTKWTWACSIPLFAFFFFLAKPMLSIFGKEFSSGWLVFILLSFSFLLNSASGSNGFFLQMIGRQHIELFNCLAVAIMNIVLNLIFITKLGINGAALATGISLISINAIRLIEIFMTVKIHPFSESHFKIGIAFILSNLITLSVNYLLKDGLENSITSFIIFLIIYFSLLYFMCLREEDKLILYGVKKKINILN